MATVADGLQAVLARIATAARGCGRDPDSVRLVAVSKTFPPGALREAFAAGQRAFGESYLQEALEKMQALSDLPLEWHFVGPIQSNKTRPIAEHFQWVQSVDRLKIAQRLNDARPLALPPLQVCIEVNITGEQTKSGVTPDRLVELASAVLALRRLQLRGLMTIPQPTSDPAAQRAQFRQLRQLRDRVADRGICLDTLSMGMSDDLEAAIAEGATIVRVGRAIFGERARGSPH